MINPATDYKTQRLAFQMFCEKRSWLFVGFAVNNKNSRQFLGRCLDRHGLQVTVLISETGGYYKLLGNKKYEKLDFLDEGEKDE